MTIPLTSAAKFQAGIMGHHGIQDLIVGHGSDTVDALSSDAFRNARLVACVNPTLPTTEIDAARTALFFRGSFREAFAGIDPGKSGLFRHIIVLFPSHDAKTFADERSEHNTLQEGDFRLLVSLLVHRGVLRVYSRGDQISVHFWRQLESDSRLDVDKFELQGIQLSAVPGFERGEFFQLLHDRSHYRLTVMRLPQPRGYLERLFSRDPLGRGPIQRFRDWWGI